MIDIVQVEDGNDIGVYPTETMRAANWLSVQLGSLEYSPQVGIDLKYFLSEDFIFQNESFKSYLIETLINAGINVAGIDEVINSLYSDFIVKIDDNETSTALIAR